MVDVRKGESYILFVVYFRTGEAPTPVGRNPPYTTLMWTVCAICAISEEYTNRFFAAKPWCPA